MIFNRRQFILGTAAGLVLPPFYERALAYFENHGEALLLPAKNAELELFAVKDWHEGWELNLGDPSEEPPHMTVREFCKRYAEGYPEVWWREGWCAEEDEVIDWEKRLNWFDTADWWCLIDSPNAKAYRYLESLDLGPELVGGQAVGELRFIDGPSPGNDYIGVEAADEVTLSLLQRRLNELGTGMRISVA